MDLNNKNILVTGGTGSFGSYFIENCLKDYDVNKIVVFSRDELKQYELRKKFGDEKVRYIIGDIQRYDNLYNATKGIDIIIHTAALKQIDTAEYNPLEFIETNINGCKNVIKAAIENKVNKIIALSTDKACNPISLYGGTKFIGDKLFQSSHLYSYKHQLKSCIVRYGNVANSRGSVIPFYKELVKKGEKTLPLTHAEMTRFWITLKQAYDMVILAIEDGQGGEIFVKKLKSFKIIDLIAALDCAPSIIGLRSNEKIHEQMIDDTDLCYEYKDHYRIYPQLKFYDLDSKLKHGAKKVTIDYTSCNNDFMTIEELKKECI